MNWKLSLSAIALGSAFVAAVPGCAADTSSGEDADADGEEAAASEDELRANASRLVGAFHRSTNDGFVRPPSFGGLVFKQDGTYFADIDTGIRCVRAPCPSNVRLEGRFTATKSYVRLNPKPGQEGGGYYGRYRYKLDGRNLTLSQSTGWKNGLTKEASYCSTGEDCWGQNLIAPACFPLSWSCGDNRQCKFSCGTPPPPANTIWPADAATLVAETKGGGFTPPPPPGSECAVGAAKYALDVAAKKVTWEVCELVNWQTPLTKKTGTTALTSAQMNTINAAMNAVTPNERDICGADKPLLTIAVGSPSQGTKTYKDSFYACWGDGPFVDHIDGVFAAFRDVTGH